MDEIDDLSSSTSDDDYVPEAESEDDEIVTDDDVDGNLSGENRNSKRKNQDDGTSPARKKRSDAFRLNGGETGCESDQTIEGSVCGNNEEDRKKRADDLWSDFKKDVEKTTSTSKVCSQENKSDATQTSSSRPLQRSIPEKREAITVTKVYDFAGEEIRVTEKLDSRLSPSAKKVMTTPNTLNSSTPTSPAEPSPIGTKKVAGLGNVLNRLGAKKKMSTLEKSRLDWNQFKNDEGIAEELSTFNKGKDGYLEKQAFLQRADMRQFEIERNLRMTDQGNR